jgi:hypothetical protein
MNGDKPNCLSPDNKSKSKTFEYEKNLFVGRAGFAHCEVTEVTH